MKWGLNHASTLEEGGTIGDTVDMFGPTDLWEPVYAMYEDTNKHREFYGHWDPLSDRWNLEDLGRPDVVYDRSMYEMARIAIRLRLWLRRAIKHINDRTVARIVDMVNWNSLRALYPPIRIVELD